MEQINWQQTIDKMAVSLGTTAEYLWITLTKGIFAEGVAGLVMCIIGLTLVPFICYRAITWAIPHLSDENNELFGSALLISIATIIIAMITVSRSLLHIKDNIIMVATPEYAAVKMIVESVKK